VCAIVQPIGEEKLPLRHVSGRGRAGQVPSAIDRCCRPHSERAQVYGLRIGSISCTEHSAHAVEFWVQDTGRGIPDSVLACCSTASGRDRWGSILGAGLGWRFAGLLEAMGARSRLDSAGRGQFSFQIDLASLLD
jgi:hypothetical protein